MSAHSPVGPSSAAQRIQCPASVALQQQYPEAGDHTAADEGEAAHWVASETLSGRPMPAEGARAPNGVFVTPEMVQGAELYVGYVQRMLAPYGLAPSDGAVEVTVSIPRVHEQAWGTPDYRAWLPTRPRPTLFLADYKFGHGIVEVFENPQLVDYAAGCLDGTRLQDTEVDVIAAIVQPRAFHRQGPIREWRFNAADIRAHVNISHAAAQEALGPNPRARTGPECEHCSARHACGTLQTAIYRAISYSGTPQPFDLPPSALGLELRFVRDAIKLLQARESGLAEQALSVTRRGGAVPGCAAEHGEGRTVWRNPTAAVAVARALGFDIAKPTEAITPKQAEARGFPVSAMPEMIEKRPGALALVVDDGSAARRVFG